MNIIDAKGKNCPIPVVMAKKEIDGGCTDFIIEVDNKIAVQNLQKLSNSQGYDSHVEETNGIFKVYFSTSCAECNSIVPQKQEAAKTTGSYVVFAGKDYIGEGSKELGSALIKMFFYTLSQSSDLPSAVLFMNNGVKLPSEDEQVIEHLKVLSEKGVDILVCGTCISYFQLPEELPVGTISNMYAILERMQKSSKVITL
jgi:selenium metabolism protein YedF